MIASTACPAAPATDPGTAPGAWTAGEIRRVGYRVVDMIADYLAGLPEEPVFRPFPPELAERLLSTPLPQAGAAADALLDEFAAAVAPYPFGNGHPRFYGWVNSPPTPIGVFAEALAAAMNPSVAGGNHAAVYLERQVSNWFKELVGFPPGSMGLLVSGGSMAGLTALAVARHVKAGFDVRRTGLQRGGPRLVAYRGEEGHGCYQKAVELLGMGSENLRVVPSDGALRMDVAALERAIVCDLAHGHRPVAVVASAGTVNTGAIDPLDDIAAVCRRHGVWLHVDAAYGGPAVLSAKYGAALRGLSLADSVALDPHKWLYVPVEAGMVLVRSAAAMRSAFSLVPPYLRTDGAGAVGGPPWLSEYGFQQSRGFRALKVWMALKHHGVEGYRRAIDHDIALADHLAARLAGLPEVETVEPRSLSIVCFRYVPARLRGDEAALDRLNRRLVETLQLGGEVFLSGTELDGRFFLRACVVNYLAREDDMDVLVRAFLRNAERLAST